MTSRRAAIGFTVAMLVAGGILIFRRLQQRRSSAPHFKTTDETMQYLAAEAVDMAAKEASVMLDYTPASIQKVEGILGRIHEEHKRTRSVSGVGGLAMAYGAYIGEVIRRSEPDAKWEQDHPVGGEKSYPLYWRGGTAFVCAWCYKRITNGDEDNVWHKYIAIKGQTENDSGRASNFPK